MEDAPIDAIVLTSIGDTAEYMAQAVDPPPSRWSCYCLLSESDRTYIGATVNLPHRLRQHNGELAGGARSTHREAGSWRVLRHIVGFSEKPTALSFEWYWKFHSRKIWRSRIRSDSVSRYERALQDTLQRFPDESLVIYAYEFE